MRLTKFVRHRRHRRRRLSSPAWAAGVQLSRQPTDQTAAIVPNNNQLSSTCDGFVFGYWNLLPLSLLLLLLQLHNNESLTTCHQFSLQIECGQWMNCAGASPGQTCASDPHLRCLWRMKNLIPKRKQKNLGDAEKNKTPKTTLVVTHLIRFIFSIHMDSGRTAGLHFFHIFEKTREKKKSMNPRRTWHWR